MRQLTHLANEERQSRGNDVTWLLEIIFPDASRYYATRPLQLGGRLYEAKIVGISGLRLELDDDLLEGSASSDRLTLTLANYAEEAAGRFELLMDEFQLEGLECRFSAFFRDAGGAAGLADIVPIQTYVIERIELSPTTITLYLVDLLTARGGKRLGRVIDEQFAPGVSPGAFGEMAPIIFGRVEDSPLVPFRFGAKTRLAAELTPQDTLAFVDSLERFPESGTLQIEGELLSYVAIDAAQRTLGTPESPLIRPNPRLHRNDTPVYYTPAGGFEFLVADHPCKSVTEVRANGAAVAPSQYSAAEEEVQGKIVQKVILPELPHKDEFSETAQRMTISGKTHESSWAVGANNTAREPQKACDPNELTTSAEISKTAQLLEIEFRGNLSNGESRYGRLEALRLGIRYFASRFWEPENTITVRVAKGAQQVEAPLARPSQKHTTGYAEPHAHGHTLSFDVQDSRPLFGVNTEREVVAFDLAEGEMDVGGGNYYWKDAARAKDGDFATGVENFSGPGLTQCSLPLTLRLGRQPREDGASLLTEIDFCVDMESADSSEKNVELRTYIPGKMNHIAPMQVDAARRRYCSALMVSDVGFVNLAHPDSCFEIRVPDGSKVRVYEAWLELRYKIVIAGQSVPLGQKKSGTIDSLPELAVLLPTHVYYQTIDLAGLAESCGGWAFFSAAGGYPTIRVQFGSATDPATLYVSDLCWEVEFRSVQRMTVAEEIAATVEGIAQGGTLLENPADIIRHVVESPDFLGLSGEYVDAESFAEVRAKLAELGYRFAARLAAPEALRDVLVGAAHEARCRLVTEAGRVRLLLSPRRLLTASSVFDFASDVLVSSDVRRKFSFPSRIVNKVTVFYQRNYDSGSGSPGERYRGMISVCDEASRAQSWGLQEANIYTRWHESGGSEVIYDLASFLLQSHAQKQVESELETPLVGIALERGDIVSVSHAASRLEGVAAQIVGVDLAALNRLGFRVRLAPRARVCWQHSAATRIQHLPGNVEKEFFIENELVATLDFLGNLQLRGLVHEGALEAFGIGAPIVYDAEGERLLFGVAVEGGGWVAAFAITRQGELQTRGELHEQSRCESIVMSACWESGEAYFAFSLNNRDAIFAYLADTETIHLGGRVRENTDFSA